MTLERRMLHEHDVKPTKATKHKHTFRPGTERRWFCECGASIECRFDLPPVTVRWR